MSFRLNTTTNRQNVGLLIGPALFIYFNFFFQAEGLPDEARSVLAGTIWITIWWITEAIPIAATALLPLLIFPLTGAVKIPELSDGYSHPIIFLFLGGFAIAIALEKSNLHRRIALLIINLIGTAENKIILGFMISTAFLSMWISNTATTVMMLPIANAVVIDGFSKNTGFKRALYLGIAYSASIGGISTIIGTPPNLVLVGVIEMTYGVEITFLQWLILGLPFSATLLFIAYMYLTRRTSSPNSSGSHNGGLGNVSTLLKEMGPASRQEKRVLIVFILAALGWICRSLFINDYLPELNDTMIALGGALILFMLPSGNGSEKILVWKDMQKVPWGILLLFGGGIALAISFKLSGLDLWISSQLDYLTSINILLVFLILILGVNFLTEITSNVATTSVILPVLISLSLNLDVHPFALMSAAAIAASCAFMLPVATPPNALVYGSGQLNLMDMVKFGFLLNIISAAIIFVFIVLLLPYLWSINIFSHPEIFTP